MIDDRAALRSRLGRVGAWTFAFDARSAADVRAGAREIESLGYPALWVPEGLSSRDIFAHMSLLLAATDRIAVCSGIANITARAPEVMANGIHTIADAYGDRPVFGIGVGHQYTTASRGLEWDHPVERMRSYLDRMDATRANSPEPLVPAPRLLAALRPRMLALSAERALGAHTYFVPTEHTARARDALGPEPVLAVELTAVVGGERDAMRRTARGFATHYLELPNYANSLRWLGFGDDDVAGGGSDRMIDAVFALGNAEAVAARVLEHLDAGADHVCIQVISGDDADVCLPQLRELAPAVLQL